MNEFLVKWICDLPNKYWLRNDKFKYSSYIWDFYLENYDNQYSIDLALYNLDGETMVYNTSFTITSQGYVDITNKQKNVAQYIQDKIMEIVSDIEFHCGVTN